jgi:hypothetical protein
MPLRHICLALSLATLCSCSLDAGAGTEQEFGSRLQTLRRRAFVEARSYVSEPEDIDAWYALLLRLRTDFDSVCGDTFCEGDFSNYESLGFRCSVESTSGSIERCVWTFAASAEAVAPRSGKIEVDVETWRCPVPVLPGTPIREFISALSSANQAPLFAPLPGTRKAIYDGLTECL